MECQKEKGEGQTGTARHRETAFILPDADICQSVSLVRRKSAIRAPFASGFSHESIQGLALVGKNSFLKSIGYFIYVSWHRECIDMLQVLQGMGRIAVPRLSC